MIPKSQSNIRRAGVFIVALFLVLISCESLEPDSQEMFYQPGIVQIIYDGIQDREYGDVAIFRVINDSSATISYMGYAPNSPFYTSEALSDTGWVPLIWGWCGTGAQILDLQPDSSFDLITPLPEYSCIWRVGLQVLDTLENTSKYLVSDPVQYTKP